MHLWARRSAEVLRQGGHYACSLRVMKPLPLDVECIQTEEKPDVNLRGAGSSQSESRN